MTREKWIEYLKDFVLAILAGVCISIGAVAFLSCKNNVVGAIFFSVGLFTILTFGFNLFTGKVCYIFNNKPSYLIKVAIIFLGNFVGTNLSALLLNFTRLSSLRERCSVIVQTKLGDDLWSLFILAIFCNILIYIAVEGFKSKNILTQYLSLFFGVSVFVICGFEHSIADMFYFAFARSYTGRTFLILIIVSLGNIVGGTLIELIKKLFKENKQDENK